MQSRRLENTAKRSSSGSADGAMHRHEDDPFAALSVIERLEVGPVHMERNRVVTPYKVTANGKDEATELAYRYQEDVFDSDDPSSHHDHCAGRVELRPVLQ